MYPARRAEEARGHGGNEGEATHGAGHRAGGGRRLHPRPQKSVVHL